MQNSALNGVVFGLDVGDVRIGVASTHSVARLPEPYEVIDRAKTDAIEHLKQIAKKEDVVLFVIGLPRYPNGQDSTQSQVVRSFSEELKSATNIPQVFVDEAFTSAEADVFKKSKLWQDQTSNDALAACLILERYFSEGATNV